MQKSKGTQNKLQYLCNRVVRKLRSLRYNHLLARNIGVTKLKIHNQPMWIDLRDQVLGRYFYIFRDYEVYETSLMERLLAPTMTVIDIGANIGFYSLICGKLLTSGKVIAFEPAPGNFELLRKNIALNHLTNIYPEQLAISDRKTQVTLYLSDLNFGDHRTYVSSDNEIANQGETRKEVVVDTISIDEYVKEANLCPDMIKMDIQGAEIFALIGMQQTLNKFKPTIFCEYWPHGLKQSGHQPEEFLDVLLAHHYTLFEIVEQDKRLRKVTSKQELTSRIEAKTAQSFGAHVNLLCMSSERLDLLNNSGLII